jgi:exopolysaccharide biosynthesis polyprenyl glycosylphosphotransferase
LIRLRLIPEYKGFEYAQLKTDFLGHVPVFYLRVSPLDMPLNRWIKRIFDVVFSSIVILLVLWWLLPILGIIIKLESKGPIFFKQKRSGMNNHDFYCYKLRSMAVNRDQDEVQATKGDRRITRFGAFLRKTSLDELPQFFNVWWGDMSVVGPRPHMIAHTEQYRQLIDQYMVRHWIKPGVTGLSQVKGYRGETTDPRMMKNRIKVDVFYLEHWTFLLDLKVVLLTVYNALRGEDNAY